MYTDYHTTESPTVSTPFLDENIDTPYSPPFFDTFDLPSYAASLNQDLFVGSYLNNNWTHGAAAEFNGDPSELLIDKSKTPQLPSCNFTPQKNDNEGLFPPLGVSQPSDRAHSEPTDDSEFAKLLDFGSPLSEQDLEEPKDEINEKDKEEPKEAKEKPTEKAKEIKEEAKEKPKRGRKRKQESDLPKKEKKAKKNSGPKTYPCPYCNHVSKRRFNLSTHIKTHDKNRVKEYECSQCLKRFDRRHDRDRHLATVHRGERSFACKDCSLHFSRRDGLSRHLAQQHEDYDFD